MNSDRYNVYGCDWRRGLWARNCWKIDTQISFMKGVKDNVKINKLVIKPNDNYW